MSSTFYVHFTQSPISILALLFNRLIVIVGQLGTSYPITYEERYYQLTESVATNPGVVTGDSKPSPPCGVCRQVLSEFVGPDFEVILATTSGEVKILTFKELFPYTFEPNDTIGDRS